MRTPHHDERDLRESEARFRQLYDEAPVGYHELDEQGRIVRINRTELEMLGFSQEEMLGRHICDFVVEKEQAVASLRAKLAGRKPPENALERTFRRKDGTKLPVLVEQRLIREQSGKIIGIRSTLQDVTWRRQAEQARHRLAAIVESSDDAIVSVSLDGEILSWNKGAKQIYGYTWEEIVGQNILRLVPAEKCQEQWDILQRVQRGETVSHHKMERLRRDGQRLIVSLTVSPLKDSNGCITGAASLARDITDILRAEEERKALENKLQQKQKLESLGILARGIAHDFNNMLTVISGNAAYLSQELDLQEQNANALRDIETAARQASDMVHVLHSFSRPSNPQKRRISINKLINDVHRLLRRAMPPKILFQTELTEQECLIQADPCQIQQMLVNLCLNARDAMDEGGTLTIRSRRVQQEQLSVETKKEIFVKCPRYAAIDVCDTGCGMPPENVQKIFDPFFTTKPKDLGTGLGLSLVHKIVEAHHGSIKVASRPGTGTRFSIYFPETAFEENQTLETLNSGEGHILIVEDEEMVAGILRTLLENKGYTVKQVSTVQKALSILEAGEPHTHLVILNYCLAGKHKGELFEQLRAIDTNLKLIVISNEAIEAIDWDPSRYRLLHKPFSIPQINQAVAELANTNSKRGDSVQAS